MLLGRHIAGYMYTKMLPAVGGRSPLSSGHSGANSVITNNPPAPLIILGAPLSPLSPPSPLSPSPLSPPPLPRREGIFSCQDYSSAHGSGCTVYTHSLPAYFTLFFLHYLPPYHFPPSSSSIILSQPSFLNLCLL